MAQVLIDVDPLSKASTPPSSVSQALIRGDVTRSVQGHRADKI